MDKDLELILDHIDKNHARSGLQYAADRIRERYSKNESMSRMAELLYEKEEEIDALKRETTADPFVKIKAMIDRSLLGKKMVMKIAKENRKEIDNLKELIAAITDQ